MKRAILILLLFTSFVSFSQEKDSKKDIFERKHELRLGAVKLLSGGIFETSYEYIKDSNQGFGASLLVNFDSGNSYLEDYSLTPFYRMYFQTYEDYGAKGFFVEGFTSFFGGKYDDDYRTDYNYGFGQPTSTTEVLVKEGDSFFDISIGLALGKKWINSAGFVFEIKAGAGRNLLGNSDRDALFKGDLYIGYRF